jgi:hypothetical protein
MLNGHAVDGGIPDINLAGAMVYPLALVLAARKVPFVFMTGYGSEVIEPPFPHVQVLQKPVDRETLRKLFVTNSPEMAFAGTRATA